jgi:YidC/Oxa1 family membrane protein insertase
MPGQEKGVQEKGERIQVRTDRFVMELDTRGGDLRHLEFVKHGDPLDRKKPFVLFEQGAERTYVVQTGLLGEGMPNHQAVYSADKKAYDLGQEDKLEVRLATQGPAGVKVEKIYTFKRGSYGVDVAFEVTNQGDKAVGFNPYFQFLRDGKPPKGDSSMVPTYTGAAAYTEQTKFVKATFDDIAKGKDLLPKHADHGWVAVAQHYFVAAWLPEKGVQREYFTRKVGDNQFTVGTVLCGAAAGVSGCSAAVVEPGKTLRLAAPLYVGPQEQKKLAAIAPGMELVIDYGMLTVIAAPLFWLLDVLYGFVGNWGWAIILLTVLIKLAFYPLSAASYKSMAKMKVVAPKLQKLKEQYGDDRQRLHQAMMELYKTEKINPLGGCLPILVQIPVFIALYWVLLYSVEIRQQPFALWLTDLTTEDPYYVLPIIMGITMFVQTKLNPTPPDPIQAKVMMAMPIMFTVFFFFFPAGLVLYWVVNNILSIAQQWMITRQIEGAKKALSKA